MNIKQTILGVLSLIVMSAGVLFYAQPVMATFASYPLIPTNPGPTTPPSELEKEKSKEKVDEAKKEAEKKKEADKKKLEDPEEGRTVQCSVLPQSICNKAKDDSGKLENSGTWALLIFVLNILTAGIGIVAVGALGYAGFLYTTAADNEGQVKQAKDMIRNTVIGIVAYGLMYVLLQFLIPGGVFT